MLHKWLLIALILLLALPLSAQEATETPDETEYLLPFPVDAPDEGAVQAAYECNVLSDEAPESIASEHAEACELAQQVMRLADNPPPEEAAPLFAEMVAQNPAMALHLDVIAAYYHQLPLVAAPDFAAQPITNVHLVYTFSGIGNQVDYDITIANADTEPEISGMVENENSFSEEETPEPLVLPETVDSDAVQSLAPALTNLLPIETQFSAVPCWDYYPDWTVTLTFEDGTEVVMATNESNIVGVGGPWQAEIDGQHYMQYSADFSIAAANLLEALALPLGETAAMGCGDINSPLFDAYPSGD